VGASGCASPKLGLLVTSQQTPQFSKMSKNRLVRHSAGIFRESTRLANRQRHPLPMSSGDMLGRRSQCSKLIRQKDGGVVPEWKWYFLSLVRCENACYRQRRITAENLGASLDSLPQSQLISQDPLKFGFVMGDLSVLFS
jgi:hypothetical protein